MAKNEKTSARVAKIAARIMAGITYAPSMIVVYLKRDRKGELSDPLYWRDIRTLAASALTQAPDTAKRQQILKDISTIYGEEILSKVKFRDEYLLPPSNKAMKAARVYVSRKLKRASSPLYPAAKPKKNSP